ncbi:MAG TPA: primosomal protein N' [Gemmatimonadaceae bacterium]|nr:primosomal protein N' [Gemmatimonadaceae bacterium]
MLVSVALPVPLFHTFTYQVPAELTSRARPGRRVVVPFRNRRAMGVIVAADVEPGNVAAKPVESIPDDEPVMSAEMLSLCAWIAEYYVAPVGVVIRSALPAALASHAAPEPSRRTRRIVAIRDELPSLLERDTTFKRAPQQRALFELIESIGGPVPVEHLTERHKFSPAVLRTLVKRELVTLADETVSRDPFARRPAPAATGHAPSAAQRAALETLAGGKSGDVFLLHGITGSGKTLVYIELLKRLVLSEGKTAIVLVPEIALTPQTVDRFRAEFGDAVAVLHSALGDGERYDEWLALREGRKQIAVGARSAIFAPLANLGAIVVDEEHESSYKQGETPRYHAREVAIVRARREGAIVVLGSATPSLESWTNAQRGTYTLITLPERVGGGRLPDVRVVDRREASRAAAVRPASERSATDWLRLVLSEELEHALSQRLQKQEQSILLLNRRGYAAFVQCETCGYVATCPNCSISLTYHRTPEGLVCHYCRHTEPLPRACPRCSGAVLRQRGLGTQQVERLLADRFPSARIARMDVDTTSGKWAHAEILDRVGSGEVDVLLGTQMIAKGLDFPNVTLVGVVDADVGINLPDFRASERCFQLLSQVAGRAGRGPRGGDVLIQTRVPTHHAVVCAMKHDYTGFVREELTARDSPAYPPTIRLANIVFSGTTESDTARLAASAVAWLHALSTKRSIHGLTVVGPAPCPVERIKNRWRWHALLKSDRAADLTKVGLYFMERFKAPKRADLRVTLDRDPVALL